MISHSKKFIFLHIPKCGGCSLHKSLKEFDSASTGHLTLEEIYKKSHIDHNMRVSETTPDDANLRDYFVFTFVRNPWGRILSTYNMWRNMRDAHPWSKYDKNQMNICRSNDFNEFVKKVKNGEISRPHVKPVVGYFIKDPSDCNFIGKMENYNEDFNKLLKMLDIPSRDIPHENIWSHKLDGKGTHYSEYYNEESIEIISEIFKKDIEHFQYKF